MLRQLIVARMLLSSNLLRLIKHFLRNKLGCLDSVTVVAVISLTSTWHRPWFMTSLDILKTTSTEIQPSDSYVDIHFASVISKRSLILSPQVQVWDTAGQERFRKSMVEHYYRNVHAVVFVYDVTKMASFRNLQTWIEVGNWL